MKHKKRIKFSARPLAPMLFSLLFAVTGIALLIMTHAAGSFQSIEPENSSKVGSVTTFNEPGASGVIFGGQITDLPSPPGTLIFKDDFEGRGQTISNGTLFNTSNTYVQNPNSSVPPVGWYPYGEHQTTFVLPQFDSSKKVGGTYSGRSGIRNQGSADGQDYTGGSYYMYRNDNNPSTKMHAYFWWQFDGGMSAGGGNCALFSAWTVTAGDGDLTYLRFYGTGATQGVLKWQAADNFQTSNSSATLQANTWYRIETTVDTSNDMTYLTIKNSSGTPISQIEYRMQASDSIRMFEFGALTARPYTAFPSAPGGASFWYDDFQLNRQ